MNAGDSLPAVFGEGEEHVKALVAGIANKVVGGHEVILRNFLSIV
jgi:hypothetical protein